MRLDEVLFRIEKEAEDSITKNKVRINRFVSKYKTARQCFYTDDENDELYDFLFDISNEYDIPEEDVYFMFVMSKYTQEGDISKTFENDFALQITLSETTKKKEQ